MNFSERIKKSFADSKNIEYGLFEIIDNKEKLVSKSTNKDSLNDQKDQLKAKVPKYVVRRISNLWSFGAYNVNPVELTCSQVLDSLQWLTANSADKKFSLECKKLYDQFDNLCKANHILNFSEDVNFGDLNDAETKWTPPEGMFSDWSAENIAKEVHKSHDTLKSGMACLNFYLNRGGDNVPDNRRKVIEEAKELLRDMYK